jgi:hypothetical protein
VSPVADHAARMERATVSLEGLSVGDAFGEELRAEPPTISARRRQRTVLAVAIVSRA